MTDASTIPKTHDPTADRSPADAPRASAPHRATAPTAAASQPAAPQTAASPTAAPQPAPPQAATPATSIPAPAADTPAPPGSQGGTSKELLGFLNRSWRELDVRLDPNTRALWCHMRPNGPPSFTPSMVRELIVLHRSIQALAASQGPHEDPHIRYYVQGSRIPGIYNMGGDLAFLTRAIRAGDRDAVRRYAFDCVDAVYHIAIGFDSGVVTVGLLEGDALGGGLEGALCCNVIIAERQVKLGLPEILFNSFPGMGAYSFLARRLDAARAERMIFSGRIFSADEMHDMGIVDQVVDEGTGAHAVSAYLAERQSHAVRRTLFQVRQRVNPLSLSELRDVTDLWVDTAMRLPQADLRRMEHLQMAQSRRLHKETGAG
ncbi:crotonase/enoyl-CoA hydratase family protein [Mongoliimonas terrestris]|uniref:crotonase/enoyl-CoA hydratase family protein n=1 Tax=Mongoliimonas terrestris TaxID=1709001 RepID=UPI0009F9BE54|nr:crotonase/enoyl-CoA hydratase family protein [Mongoliimonas terrestris]